MKRDFDLIRKILLQIESEYDGDAMIMQSIEGYSDPLYVYHCELLIDRGLVKGKVERDSAGGIFLCFGLSWDGQDYLASIRNNTVWSKVKKTAVEKGIDLTIDIIAKLAAKFTQELLDK